MPVVTPEQAHRLVRRALASGALAKPDACEGCGQPAKRLLAHHVTYCRPIDVLWLCAGCHAQAHPRPQPRPKPGTAAARAGPELRSNPYRSDRAIAGLIGVDHHSVSRARRALERAGVIEPTAKRTPRWPNGPRSPGRAQQAVLDLGPSATTRQVMDASGVGRGAAWRARTHPRVSVSSGHANRSAADAAAATDALSVVRSRTGSTRLRVGNTLPAGYYAAPDPIETQCPACTLEYTPTGWRHSRSCIFRNTAARS
jgi:hypothetical protein